MSDQSNKTGTARWIATGYQYQALVFMTLWRELRERYGLEAAREIAGKAARQAGFEMGRLVAPEIGRSGPRGVAEAWDLMYGPNPDAVVELADDRFIYRGSGCPAFSLWAKMGLGPAEIAEMGNAFCAIDHGFGRAFGPDVQCIHTARLMNGDSYCEWVHTQRPQSEPASRQAE